MSRALSSLGVPAEFRRDFTGVFTGTTGCAVKTSVVLVVRSNKIGDFDTVGSATGADDFGGLPRPRLHGEERTTWLLTLSLLPQKPFASLEMATLVGRTGTGGGGKIIEDGTSNG